MPRMQLLWLGFPHICYAVIHVGIFVLKKGFYISVILQSFFHILGYQSRLVFCTFDDEAYSDYLCASFPRPLSKPHMQWTAVPTNPQVQHFQLKATCSALGA